MDTRHGMLGITGSRRATTCVAATLAVGACMGIAPALAQEAAQPPVALVGDAMISQAEFDHWIAVVSSMAGRTEPELVPPPGSQPWRRLKGQVMLFLVSGAWLTEEADRQGIALSDEAVLKRFVMQRDANFATRTKWERFLRRNGMTSDDVKYRVRLDMLSNRLRRKATAPYDSPRRQMRALNEFTAEFQDRWAAQTRCAPAYKIAMCGGDPLEISPATPE